MRKVYMFNAEIAIAFVTQFSDVWLDSLKICRISIWRLWGTRSALLSLKRVD